MRAIKPSSKEQSFPFIVADIETVMVDGIHFPYAAGFLVVNPGDDMTSLPSSSIQTFFTEEEEHLSHIPKFSDRSEHMLNSFCSSLEELVGSDSSGCRTIYFHNLSRFDGLFILRFYAVLRKVYRIKCLIRNHLLYEIKIYRGTRLLFRFRDSFTLLPSSLDSLSQTLCPELGSKGSLPHSDLVVEDLRNKRGEILDYLRRDILLLGGVLRKTQDIFWTQYQIDIEDIMTISSLALRLFRVHFFDKERFRICYPNLNQDTFIRRGYYGGHVDVYMPYGEDLYHYDVNSLYPYIMKEAPMPSGEPVWHSNLEERDLEDLYGFVEAYIVCPNTMERPFLPYKDKGGTLLFPTGRFLGVYFTEELKYAKTLGYRVVPLRGYLFEKSPSPFSEIISDLYQKRLEAKERENAPMALIYKLIMNSLYGRFGVNPESTGTALCNRKEYEQWLRKESFLSADQVSEDFFLIHYKTQAYSLDHEEWKAPKISAVHLSAAITAYSRIYMYPYISRADCYYTDTDSIVVGNPLPEEMVSSTKLGLFKLEHKIWRGIFLAPKSYCLMVEGEEGKIIRYKGPAKDLISSDWFHLLYDNPSLTMELSLETNFSIDWTNLSIGKKKKEIRLGIQKSRKRDKVFDETGRWVSTRPINVFDLGSSDATAIMKRELLYKHSK